MKLSDIFYQERHKRRMTLRDVAEKIGCSAMSISNIETGRFIPGDGSEVMTNLCNLYCLDLDAMRRLADNENGKGRVVDEKPVDMFNGGKA